MKPSDDLIVSSTEPTGLNRKKVWMQNTADEKKIYVRNDNNVYEEFIGKEEALHESVFESALPDVEANTNVSFIEMFPRLNLDDVICFNVEITDVYSTWDRTYAHILKKTGVLQVRSYAEKQMVTVRVTAFYK